MCVRQKKTGAVVWVGSAHMRYDALNSFRGACSRRGLRHVKLKEETSVLEKVWPLGSGAYSLFICLHTVVTTKVNIFFLISDSKHTHAITDNLSSWGSPSMAARWALKLTLTAKDVRQHFVLLISTSFPPFSWCSSGWLFLY